jgi:mannose-6-phosphate isomerase-like protein (cupin superfamily)
MYAKVSVAYQPEFYSGSSDNDIKAAFRTEGAAPECIYEPAGFTYETHSRPYDIVLAYLDGEMELNVDGEEYHCLPGDRMFIPAHTEHSAVVGPRGCIYVWVALL